MSRWTSKRAILRDLSLAQGGGAGGGGAGGGGCGPAPLAAAERPPPLVVREETEEEYFEHCVGDGNALDEPDLGLIRRMLDMVRDLNVPEEEVKTAEVAVITKLNPSSSEFIPLSAKSTAKPQYFPATTEPEVESLLENVPSTKKITKRKRQRNIALESILQAMEIREQNGHIEPLKLLKPEDLVPKTQEKINIKSIDRSAQNGEIKQTECCNSDKDTDHYDTKVKNKAVEKVNDWMTQMTCPIRTKPVTVMLDATSMFKKKCKSKAETCEPSVSPSTILNMKAVDKSKVRDSKFSSGKGNGAYIPSTQAGQYYQRYLEKSQLMDSLHDDIWTKAEKKMKQIDEQKRLQAAQRAVETEAEGEAEVEGEGEASSASLSSELSGDGIPTGGAWRAVRLPRARHELRARGEPGASCIVCDAVARARASERSDTGERATSAASVDPSTRPSLG